ncbi:MAG: DUF2459 domain-containing protein [Bacteroidales bacterium]|nr:DUF2459 domain-containing protein [Bacteroidales bacterium]
MMRWIVYLTLAGLLSLWLQGCSSSRDIPYPPQKDEPSIPVYVTKRGWHTGILIPRGSLDTLLPHVAGDFAEATHLNFSWGDRKYFMAPKGTVGLALRAALLPTQSVVHVDGFNYLPSGYTDRQDVVPLELTREGFKSMVRFIGGSFQRDSSCGSSAALIPLREKPRAMSCFYLSNIAYWGTRTCNVWTARALKKAGVDIHPAFSLTARQVMQKVIEQQ